MFLLDAAIPSHDGIIFLYHAEEGGHRLGGKHDNDGERSGHTTDDSQKLTAEEPMGVCHRQK